MVELILILIALTVYFLPSIIGWNSPKSEWIIGINIFIGWTIIGWLLALGMACTNYDEPQRTIIQKIPKEDDNLDKLKKLKDLLDSGAITTEEYATEKQKLLNQNPL